MSGLVKAKKYDWKDSNMALFGSDTEKQVKKESAEAEPAWEGAGQEVGLKIWRIVKFEVTEWSTEDYGKFYSGDSYIILNTYQEDDSDALLYDVHFWIGQHSSQDEYGTAAYKTVELDTLLDDKAVQHREVASHESDLFMSYFESISLLKGGAESGFRHVTEEEYKPRLLKVSGTRKTVTVTELPTARSRLNSDDVFILDLGKQIYQYNGKTCNKDEKFKAAQMAHKMKGEQSANMEVLEEDDMPYSHPFFDALTDDDEDDEDVPDEAGDKKMFKVSDASGSLEFTEVDPVSSADELDNSEVYVLDNGTGAFVWIGSGASANEKKNGMGYAHKMLQTGSHPFVPVVVVKQGQRCSEFDTAIAA